MRFRIRKHHGLCDLGARLGRIIGAATNPARPSGGAPGSRRLPGTRPGRPTRHGTVHGPVRVGGLRLVTALTASR
jgi:hypothetical protein